MAKDSNVKKLIINYLKNVEADEDVTKVAVAENFNGELFFAKDLMEIKISK